MRRKLKRGPIGALSRRRPTPAMAVAILALVFAMVGTAAATQALHQGGAHASKKKKKSKPIRGPAGPPGANGTNGANGADGTAKAYAHVLGSSGGSIGSSIVGGITTAKEGTGQYCIHVPFTPQNVMVTVDTSGAVVRIPEAGLGAYGTCAGLLTGGSNAFVVIRDASAAVQDTDFFVAVN